MADDDATRIQRALTEARNVMQSSNNQERIQAGGTVPFGQVTPPKVLSDLRDRERRDSERRHQMERELWRPEPRSLGDAMRIALEAEFAAIDAKYAAIDEAGRIGRPITPPAGKTPSGGRPR